MKLPKKLRYSNFDDNNKHFKANKALSTHL